MTTKTPRTPTPAVQIEGHYLTVTLGVFGRAFVDCECGYRARRASMHAGNLAAFDHQRQVRESEAPAATRGPDPLADVEGGGPLG